MGIADDTGNMVAGAMALGLLLNKQSQDSQDATYWHNQAMQLQAALNAHIDLTNSQRKVIAQKNDELDCLEANLANANKTLEQTKQELATQVSYKEMNRRQLDCALDSISGLHARLIKQSSQTKGTHALYEKLVEEISQLSDPAIFPSLDPKIRDEIFNSAVAAWEAKEKLSYTPNFSIKTAPPAD